MPQRAAAIPRRRAQTRLMRGASRSDLRRRRRRARLEPGRALMSDANPPPDDPAAHANQRADARAQRYIAQAPQRRLPAAVAEKARHHVLDTMAAMVSGARLAPGRAAIAYVRGLGGTRAGVGRRQPGGDLVRQRGARQRHAGACGRDRRFACALAQPSGLRGGAGGAGRRGSRRTPAASSSCARWCSAMTWRRGSTTRSAPTPLRSRAA